MTFQLVKSFCPKKYFIWNILLSKICYYYHVCLVDLFVTFTKKDKMYYLKRTIKIRAPHNMQVDTCGLDVSDLV